MEKVYDVAVIGGGVVGGMTLRELSRYQLKTILLEQAEDVVMGASKANSAIVHAGFDAEPGTLKAQYNVEGNALMEAVTGELSVPFRRNGSMVLAFSEEDLKTLRDLQERGRKNGVPGVRLMSREEALSQEPNLSEEIKGALWAPSGGIVCPYELATAAIGNAMDNGAELKTGFRVTGIEKENGNFVVISEAGEKLYARYLVNAAGVHADEVARMIGDDSFSITPRRGEYMLLDKTQGATVFATIFQPPTKMGKGVLVTPTVDGNLLVGPTSEDIFDKDDTATTPEGLEKVERLSKLSVPSVNLRAVITSFAGLRATPDGGDFIIGPSAADAGFINAAGIESPGLTASPAIAVAVVKHLEEAGLVLIKRENFSPFRKPFPKFRRMSGAEREALIRQDASFGRIVCRCETITEGEILAAIHRNPPARDVDAVKRRTRAGMGRCQGGFCGPQVVEILSRELGIPMDEVTKCGGASRMLVGKTKETQ